MTRIGKAGVLIAGMMLLAGCVAPAPSPEEAQERIDALVAEVDATMVDIIDTLSQAGVEIVTATTGVNQCMNGMDILGISYVAGAASAEGDYEAMYGNAVEALEADGWEISVESTDDHPNDPDREPTPFAQLTRDATTVSVGESWAQPGVMEISTHRSDDCIRIPDDADVSDYETLEKDLLGG